MAYIPDEAIDNMDELSAGAYRLYTFLCRCRNQKTAQCNPSARVTGDSIGVNRGTVYALRKELTVKNWAEFHGDAAVLLKGFSLKIQTDNDASKATYADSATQESEESDSLKNQTNLDGNNPLSKSLKNQTDCQKSEKSDLGVRKIRLDSLKIQTDLSEKSDSHIRKNQQRNQQREPISSDAAASPADFSANAAANEPPPDNSTASDPTRRSGKRRPIPEYEIFSVRFQREYGMPYQSAAKDFVQFAGLQKKCADTNWQLTEANFCRAMENYFGSELGQHTFADLCARFSAFFRSPLDRFGKPVAHANGKPTQSTLAEKLDEASKGAYKILFGEDRNPQPFVDAEVIS